MQGSVGIDVVYSKYSEEKFQLVLPSVWWKKKKRPYNFILNSKHRLSLFESRGIFKMASSGEGNIHSAK